MVRYANQRTQTAGRDGYIETPIGYVLYNDLPREGA